MRWAKVGSFILMGTALAAAGAILLRQSNNPLLRSIHLDPVWIVLSFVAFCPGFLVAVAVWHRVLVRFGIQRPFRVTLRIYSYSAIAVALPGSIWPIAGRSLLYQREGANGLRVATASVVESFAIGIAAMAVYAVGVMAWPDMHLWSRPELGIGVASTVFLLLSPPVFNRLSSWALARTKGHTEPAAVSIRAKDLLGWVALECLVVVIGGIALALLLSSLVVVPVTLLPRVVIAWAAASAIGNLFFWLPATSLLRDGALILALTPTLPMPLVILFALLVRVWSITSLLIIAGLIWLWLDCPLWTGRRRESA
jgi:hypothetical protein